MLCRLSWQSGKGLSPCWRTPWYDGACLWQSLSPPDEAGHIPDISHVERASPSMSWSCQVARLRNDGRSCRCSPHPYFHSVDTGFFSHGV